MSAAASGPGMRLDYLDGLRGVAILLVLGFHYFTCFQAITPHGNVWAGFAPFRWGHYGVQLFFAVSGFVIAMTLERCPSVDLFIVRRFARLWPTMLLCSVLSYTVLSLLPSAWPQSPVNFLPSLTFIDGQVWNKLVPGLQAEWIDVAYWSLFVEVRFYALAALVWFAAPRRFAAVFFAATSALVAVYVLAQGTPFALRAEWLQWAFAARFLPWFGVGLAAHLLVRGRRRAGAWGLATACLQAGALAWAGDTQMNLAVLPAVIALVVAPARWPALRRALAAPGLVAIGAASYSLYLLHQYAGLALVDAAARLTGLRGAAALPLALAMVLVMLGLSRLIHRHWESPLNTWIARRYGAWRSGLQGRAQAGQPHGVDA